ncbi:hypothetical protein YC2023_098763 [Brassica napus]
MRQSDLVRQNVSTKDGYNDGKEPVVYGLSLAALSITIRVSRGGDRSADDRLRRNDEVTS